MLLAVAPWKASVLEVGLLALLTAAQPSSIPVDHLQAASGAGQAAMDELEQQTREVLEGKPPTQNIFPFQVQTCQPHRLFFG